MRARVRCAGALACASLATLFAGFDSSPLAAQTRHSIGLTAKGAQLWLEEGSYPHSPGSFDSFGASLAVGDFNGDGFDDLAAGIPANPCDPVNLRCGSAQVRLGSPATPLANRVVLSPVANPLDLAQAEERYGHALAAGDWNGDGFDDLAVGVPFNFVPMNGSFIQAGTVQLHFGLPAGSGTLQSVAGHSFSKGPGAGLPGLPSAFELFGFAVAFGDFNGDQRDDLAVGIPYSRSACGATLCSPGSAMVIDLNADGEVGGYTMALGMTGLPGAQADQDQYGWAVATGDFNGDGYDDLATGIPHRDGWGAVLVVYGSPFSLLFAEHQFFFQGSFGETAEAGDEFGKTLAAGDFNNDGYDDLAMGAPGEDGAGPDRIDSGEVIVSYGSTAGLLTGQAPWLTEDGIFGSGSEAGDRFGSALTAGDFDADGYDDLVVGMAGEDTAFAGESSGAALLLRGAYHGLVGSPARHLWPHLYPWGLIAQRPGETDELAGFGSALAAGDFDGNGFDDLAIGAPTRQLLPVAGPGAVAVIYGQLFIDGFESADALEWSAVAP